MCLRFILACARSPGRLPFVDQQATSLGIVAVMNVGAIFELMSFDLSMHLASYWIHRSALIGVCLIAVGERFTGKKNITRILVVGLCNAMVDVTRMNRLVAAFIGDLHHVPGATIGAGISIINVITTRMRDPRDLANPLWRSRSASVIGRVIWIAFFRASRVGNSINVPVRIVMDPSRLPLKIGVILKHLLWRIVVLVVVANVLGVMVERIISEAATRTVAAGLGKRFWQIASTSGRSRID